MTTLAVKWVIQDHLASLAHRRGPCSGVLCGFREEGAVRVEAPFSGVREEEHCFGAFSGRGVEDEVVGAEPPSRSRHCVSCHRARNQIGGVELVASCWE